MKNFSRTLKILATLAIVALSLQEMLSVNANRHHHGSSSSGTSGDSSVNMDEYLPAVCANGETMTRRQHQHDVDSFKNCPYQRSDALSIFNKGFDLNGDGGLDIEECNLARNYYLTSLERAFVEDCDTVMKHCDCDGDGVITMDDLEKAVFTCIRDCKTATIVATYISSRMKGNAFEGKH